MSEHLTRSEEFDNILRKFLGPNLSELKDIIDDIQREVADRRYIIELPDANIVDVPLEEMASLVARTSNAYGRVARFCGKCRAEYDLAAGRYKRKYEQHKADGSNDAERRANSMRACKDEHAAMTIAEAAWHYAEQLEASIRVASESARKIYDKVASMWVAQGREEKGTHQGKDFTEKW